MHRWLSVQPADQCVHLFDHVTVFHINNISSLRNYLGVAVCTRRTAEQQTAEAAAEYLATEDDSASIADASLLSASTAAGREAALAAENKDLVVRLSATHRKLKLLRSKGQQREAMQEAQVSAIAT